eukprot:scaffold476865_cov20-Prasinocladus_malaysianus.AAC.1
MIVEVDEVAAGLLVAIPPARKFCRSLRRQLLYKYEHEYAFQSWEQKLSYLHMDISMYKIILCPNITNELYIRPYPTWNAYTRNSILGFQDQQNRETLLCHAAQETMSFSQ